MPPFNAQAYSYSPVNRTMNSSGPSGFFSGGGAQTQQDLIDSGQMAVSRNPNSGNFWDRIGEFMNAKRMSDAESNLDRSREMLRRGGGGIADFARVNQAYAEDEDLSGRNDLFRILNEFYVPDYMDQRESLGQREDDFFQNLYGDVDLTQVIAGLTAASQGAISEAGKPGGAIDLATQTAASGAAESGFGVSSGTFDRSRLNVLGRLNDSIANLMAQQAPALYSTAVQNRLGSLEAGGSYLTNAQGRLSDLRDSIFTGRTNIESLRLAQRQLAESSLLNRENLKLEQKAQSGGGIGGFLGGVLGTAVGSFAGGVGAAAGGKLGSSLFS